MVSVGGMWVSLWSRGSGLGGPTALRRGAGRKAWGCVGPQTGQGCGVLDGLDVGARVCVRSICGCAELPGKGHRARAASGGELCPGCPHLGAVTAGGGCGVAAQGFGGRAFSLSLISPDVAFKPEDQGHLWGGRRHVWSEAWPCQQQGQEGAEETAGNFQGGQRQRADAWEARGVPGGAEATCSRIFAQNHNSCGIQPGGHRPRDHCALNSPALRNSRHVSNSRRHPMGLKTQGADVKRLSTPRAWLVGSRHQGWPWTQCARLESWKPFLQLQGPAVPASWGLRAVRSAAQARRLQVGWQDAPTSV